MNHVDYDWISKKIGGHGGTYSCYTNTGIIRIGYIGSTSKIKVFWYNVILFFKYLKRKFGGKR